MITYTYLHDTITVGDAAAHIYKNNRNSFMDILWSIVLLLCMMNLELRLRA